jgi:hypothetical protein
MRFASPLRRRTRNLLELTVAILAAAGCHRIALTPQEEAVRVIRDPAQVTRCRAVKEIESSDRLSGGLVNREKAEANTYMILKQKAAKLGANTVLINSASSGMAGAGMKGTAYVCTAG